MINLVLMLLMALAGASLAGALLFLYRWLVRRKLFPQLPRIWGVDRLRAIIFCGVFLVLAAAWAVTALLSQPDAPAPATPATPAAGPASQAARAPSTTQAVSRPGGGAEQDREEEKYFPLPHRAPAAGDERALPPGPDRPLPGAEGGAAAPAWATVTSLTTERTASTSLTTTTSLSTTTTTATTLAPTTSQTTTLTTAAPTTAAPTTSATTTLTTASTATTLAPAPAKAKPAAGAPTSPAGPAVYAACLGSYKQEAQAQAHAARLTAQGVKAEAVAVDLGAKGNWWRVYAGEFADMAAAQAQGKAWEKQGLATTPFPVRRR